MSKTTKIIAALGVVAGLGVAALPAFTYATASVSGNADLYVKVDPAIAMTITGNNDDSTDGDHLHQTGESTSPDAHGAANRANPDGAFGITANTLTSSSKIASMLPNAYASTTSTVTVYTNDAGGYGLTALAATPALTNESSDTIAAGVLTGETGGQGLWSFKTDADDTEETGIVAADDWAAMSTTAQTIRNTATRAMSGDPTVVTYGVSTGANQGTGVYKTSITYTATTHN